jgi:1,4-alpha-glucan branching enzyme
MKSKVVSIILNAHLPFIPRPGFPTSREESWFFEALSETYIPLLEMLDHLDADHIPFKLGLALSPVLSHLLRDETLLIHYLEYVDRQIEFGARELDRTVGDSLLHPLARAYYDRVLDKRILFTERYEMDILNVLDLYQKKGRLEILTTSATHCFLPLYAACPEAVQAQLEVAVSSYRNVFGRNPQGFWLPEFGWCAELDVFLKAYNFSYTMVDTHGALMGSGEARRGCFYPVKTPSQMFVLIRDYYAHRDLFDPERGYCSSPVYQDYYRDAGYELARELVEPFRGELGVRMPTGLKYWAQGNEDAGRGIYDAQKAQAEARKHARFFLDNRISRLDQAGEYMTETPISLCAYNADHLGRFWREGFTFLETIYREGADREEIQFMNPADYLFKQNIPEMETVIPEFSSWGTNGYAEMWLNSSNDWMYRHTARSMDRMIELAERFPNDSGLKERALNQAARELLLAQSSDWPRMLYNREFPDFAGGRIKLFLRNFMTIYEALGSNYISTEWLTTLERRHNIFPHINYRVFRRKR